MPNVKEQGAENDGNDDIDEEGEVDTDHSVSVPTQFEQLTRELEVKVYTGFPSTEPLKFLFNYLSGKARSMQYWRGGKQITKETPQPPSPFELAASFVKRRPGPERKLRLEQELVLTSMKLGLGPLVLDLGFRFHVSTTTSVSSIFITWVKLISRNCQLQLYGLVDNKSRKLYHSSCLRKPYPKVRGIIDYLECFTETPSGLDLAATQTLA